MPPLSRQRSGNVNSSNTLLWEWMSFLKRYFDKGSCRRRNLLPLIGRFSEKVTDLAACEQTLADSMRHRRQPLNRAPALTQRRRTPW